MVEFVPRCITFFLRVFLALNLAKVYAQMLSRDGIEDCFIIFVEFR